MMLRHIIRLPGPDFSSSIHCSYSKKIQQNNIRNRENCPKDGVPSLVVLMSLAGYTVGCFVLIERFIKFVSGHLYDQYFSILVLNIDLFVW